MATAFKTVGQRTKRLDSPAKLTGREKFTADLRLPGMVHAVIVGSDLAHGRINGVDKEAALRMPGVIAVLTNDDLPIHRDANGNPVAELLAGDEALHVGHPIALVLAETAVAAQDAAEAVVVDIEALPTVSDLHAAILEDAPRVSADKAGAFEDEASMHNADAATATIDKSELPPNVSNAADVERGDIEAGFAEADEIVELSLTSQALHQGYIEPQVCLAAPDAFDKLTVYTSTQGAFHGRQKVADTLGMPLNSVNIVQMPVGGGFGGKFVLIEPLVAAAARAVNRPVLLQYTRTDDFLAGNPAPECAMTIRLGAKRDGTLTAINVDLLFDAGAASGSPLGIAAVLVGGYYRFPNLRIKGYETRTHRPSSGSYRAPGAQQATFAIESAIGEMCERLGLDPVEMRLMNCAVEGDLRPNGGEWPRIGLKETIEALRDHPAWQNREEARAKGHGVGIAVGGWPGGIEPASAACRLDADGKLTVMLGSVDLNGTNTTFAQIAAEQLGTGVEDVRVQTVDTDGAPFAGGTGGSKITYTVGPAVKRAVDDAVEQIKQIAADRLEAAPEDLELADGVVRVKGVPDASVSLKEIARLSMSTGPGGYLPVQGRGGSGINKSSPGFAAHLAEVSVDEMTGVVTVHRYVAVQDVGFAINPATVEGQIQGGVVQGLGWALYEGMPYDEDGQPLASSLMDYTLPRARMAPPIETVLVEVPSEDGPFGAKGVGEPPAIPGAAAVANAIRDAVGVRITSLPMVPAKVLEALG
ncbi:MAG TPA: xanthine dehydrogenase family protein molybdopterin-binding subunit [Thermomicrobiales bacterium]|nr:xanthine dehydrogenase family protein molybdopterin-binding subunit [Thermomicrobiales bacterium]